jgi:hypothetical protein
MNPEPEGYHVVLVNTNACLFCKQHYLSAAPLDWTHKSRSGVSTSTSIEVIWRYSLFRWNEKRGYFQITWSMVSWSPEHTHIPSSTIPKRFKFAYTPQCPDIIHEIVVTTFHSANHGLKVTEEIVEWMNRTVSCVQLVVFHIANHLKWPVLPPD